MVDKEVFQLKVLDFYYLLTIKDVDLLFAHKLLNQIYNVAKSRHSVQIAETPEGEALARWDVERAREALNSTLSTWNICDLDKVLVRWIADHCEFNEDDKRPY